MRHLILMIGVVSLPYGVDIADAGSCETAVIAVDTSEAFPQGIELIFGKALGQTFTASDTLIRRITVWKPKYDARNDSPMKLWITRADSSGRPITSAVILDGPVLFAPNGDGVHPVEVRYDPVSPIVLPSRGHYAFFIQHMCAGLFDLMIAVHDVYPGGSAWQTGRSLTTGCRYLSDYMLGGGDLVFEIEFCRQVSTPVVRRSWGRLKLIYR